jgi:two-component system alkaline phosphatase synthesis response regulator PhoP
MSQAKCRILCVDDHEDTSEMLTLLLAQEDYEVVTAVTVQEALQLAKTTEFDLYVLDKRLPDGSGLDLCKKLTLLTPGVPCMFYTGDAYEVHKHEAIAAGADSYVAKPDIDGLIEGVNKLLAGKECATSAPVVLSPQQ